MRIIREEETWKKFLFTLNVIDPDLIVDVYLVDTKFIRDTFDNSFAGGTNWKANTYVPEKEIWLAETDTLLHEFIESLTMTYFSDISYDYAHEFTSIIETFVRNYK